MTYEDAEICLEQGFSVVCARAPRDRQYLLGNKYHIAYVNKGKNRKDKGLNTSVGLETSARCVESIDPSYIELSEEWQGAFVSAEKNKKNSLFSSLINDLRSAGLNQTQIVDHVKKINKKLKGK